jgi:hypothetical protein
LSTGYIREWPPLLDGIHHVQRVRGGTIEDAWRELQPALYEGNVKSRRSGVRYRTFRYDGIEPSTWHRAALIPHLGAVVFNYDGRHIVTNPAHPNYLPLYQVEICWPDVLRWWPQSGKTDDHARTKKRKVRRDEKRPEIAGAVAALADSTGWQGSSDKERCRLVERHLKKPAGWCSQRTLGRAVAARAK